MSYRELYQNLFNAHVVSPYHLKPLQSLYPKWYDANAQCDYHAGIARHSIEHCTAFKKLVERHISMGIVKVDDSPSIENLLPNHNENEVNMIGGNMGREIKEDIVIVKIPLRWIWKKMVERGLLEMEFYEEVKEEESICTFESTKVPRVTQPVVIISRPRNDEVRAPVMPRIIIKKLVTFSYQDSRKVPWNYECNTTVPGIETTKDQDVSANPEHVKGRAMIVEQEGEIAKPVLSINEPVKEEEAMKFLKFLKHSEYNVVEQLHKQPACISVLTLLLNSEVYQSALMRMLNETYVADDISVSKLDRLVNNIRVLIDNGSALNVLPLFTLNRLPIDRRPWIHSVGAVPSSLHQKLKLVSEGRLVIINAEEDIIAAVSNEMSYVETSDESAECSFRSLEFVNVAFVPEGSKVLVPKLSKTTKMGLGRYLQGRIEFPVLKGKQDHFGLGYKPDRGQRKKELEKRQERKRACLSGEETKWEPMIIPHVSKTFVSGGVIHAERKIPIEESIEETLGDMHINAIHEHLNEERSWLDIRPYEPGRFKPRFRHKGVEKAKPGIFPLFRPPQTVVPAPEIAGRRGGPRRADDRPMAGGQRG
ncbi:uncharacterized protein LOC128042507 [Gossypium raimondii]|uniref:uncharacterized protein LOC128042507 n=1 Tax=Gossypium raimondii TaxID=29730 RepID=UPI00227B7423|nr:uncharacterized protein LOC128042507 [Gossypium raimondii]